MNSFYAWIGNTDIRYYQNAALQRLDSKENAPVNIALNKIPFEKIVLFLTGEHHATLSLLKSCLPSYTEFIFADLSSPVNYRVSCSDINETVLREKTGDTFLWFMKLTVNRIQHDIQFCQ